MARRALVRGPEGNLSLRVRDDRFLITRRGANLGRLNSSDVISCRLGDDMPDAVSSEVGLHAAVLAVSRNIGAVIHAHPPAVLALSLRGVVPDTGLLLEGKALVGSVALVPAWPPGSEELAQACADAVKLSGLVVLAQHGALAVASSLAEALLRLEIGELTASMMLAGQDVR